jgi:hypothetical protein
MFSDNRSTATQRMTLAPQILYRGLYIRIARKLRVDPSYVSRVARGERHSRQIEDALQHELQDINQRLNRHSPHSNGRSAHRGESANRLKTLMRQNRSNVRKQWLRHSQANPHLRKVKIAPQKLTAPILPVFDEALRVMKLSLKEMASVPMKAAQRHGHLRQAQGFSASDLIEEYNLVRRCVFSLAEEHIQEMDAHLLLHDLTQFGEALDLQSQRALENFLAAA